MSPDAVAAGFGDFVWAVGEEGSDPIVERDGAPYRHDQFAASGHYDHVEDDVAAVADLGVRWLRYGMPWRLAEPEPGRYDWSRWDRGLAACEQAGVEPIVDLLHFGLPDHHHGFLDRGWVEGFQRYVDAFAARYPGLRWFTPVNEPGITALMSGLFGGWNDRGRSLADYARVLAHVTLANLGALARLGADRDAWWIGSEGFGVPMARTPAAEEEAEQVRATQWLVWDLHLGIAPLPAAARLLDAVDDDVLARIDALTPRPDRLVAGHDVYPNALLPIGGPAPEWTIAERLDAYAAEARRWHARYRVPFWISETSNLSLPVADQEPWLTAFSARLARLRAEGLPIHGLCWYSRGDQYDWDHALLEPRGAVTEVGLFDAPRRARPVATSFARLVAAGAPRAADAGRPGQPDATP